MNNVTPRVKKVESCQENLKLRLEHMWWQLLSGKVCCQTKSREVVAWAQTLGTDVLQVVVLQ
jgi:hypothetical protein